MPTLPLETIKPLTAPPVFKIKPPVLDWPVEPVLRGAAALPPGGATCRLYPAALRQH
ncbi:MAG: hypothetical protein HYY86_00360 [Candidatus Harrisonbacteria bacterium]|nr:hypothetical protein [Candidatus Harrisonbacteria bacterium]